MSRTVSGITLTLLLIGLSTSALGIQPAEGAEPPLTEWTKTYSGLYDDWGFSIVQTSDGGYAIAGYTRSYGTSNGDFWLVKTDSAGNMQWNRTYGGTGDDLAYSMVQTNDGGYALAGYHAQSGGLPDSWLVKTDWSGNQQWSRTYGTAGGSDEAHSMVQTGDGGYALAGYTDSYGISNGDFWLVKTDSAGTVLWNRTYGGTWDEMVNSVVQTADAGYALAGWTRSFGAGSYDFWLVKTDSSGNMLWNRTYGGANDDEAWSVVQTSDGGYALAGTTCSYGTGSGDFWLVKIDASGDVLWSRTYGGIQHDQAMSVVQTSGGMYAIAGLTSSYGAGSCDFWMIETDSVGNALWNRTYGGIHQDVVYSVIQTSDGGYALVGTTDAETEAADVWLVKVANSPPSLGWISRTPTTPCYHDEVIVITTITDDTAVEGALLSYTYGLTWHNATMIKSGDTFNAAIPAQPYGTTVQYRIYANDISGNWVVSDWFSYTVVDVIEPLIETSRSPEQPYKGQSVKVLADVIEPSNASGVKNVTFYYRVNNNPWWMTTMVFNPALQKWETTIPDQEAHNKVEYYVRAQDYAGNENTTATFSYIVALIPGDVNADGEVDILDVSVISAHWYPGPPEGPSGYDSNFDINNDGAIDIIEISIISAHWTGPPKGPLAP